jgi:hypothetical protein
MQYQHVGSILNNQYVVWLRLNENQGLDAIPHANSF